MAQYAADWIVAEPAKYQEGRRRRRAAAAAPPGTAPAWASRPACRCRTRHARPRGRRTARPRARPRDAGPDGLSGPAAEGGFSPLAKKALQLGPPACVSWLLLVALVPRSSSPRARRGAHARALDVLAASTTLVADEVGGNDPRT